MPGSPSSDRTRGSAKGFNILGRCAPRSVAQKDRLRQKTSVLISSGGADPSGRHRTERGVPSAGKSRKSAENRAFSYQNNQSTKAILECKQEGGLGVVGVGRVVGEQVIIRVVGFFAWIEFPEFCNDGIESGRATFSAKL